MPHLEETLIVPVGVDLGQLGGQAVVLPQPHGVHAGQRHLLVDPDVTCESRVTHGIAG